MAGRGGGGRKVLLPPINFIFKLLQTHAPVKIWLYEQLSIRIEGKIRVSGFLSQWFMLHHYAAMANTGVSRDLTSS